MELLPPLAQGTVARFVDACCASRNKSDTTPTEPRAPRTHAVAHRVGNNEKARADFRRPLSAAINPSAEQIQTFSEPAPYPAWRVVSPELP